VPASVTARNPYILLHFDAVLVLDICTVERYLLEVFRGGKIRITPFYNYNPLNGRER